jgi:hypothetical protein
VVFKIETVHIRRYQDRFKMSKKTFKKAIGALYRKANRNQRRRNIRLKNKRKTNPKVSLSLIKI